MALRASRGQHAAVGKSLVDRFHALEPEQAAELAGDHRAGAGDPGRDRRRGQHAQRRAALERGGDPGGGVDGQPADEEHRHAGEPERHDTIAPPRRGAVPQPARSRAPSA